MGRDRQRVCLQDGLRLDLNGLIRRGFITPGAKTGPVGISWTHSYWGDLGQGMIWGDLRGDAEGWFRISLGKLDQWVILLPRKRRFGGFQWYFICPVMSRRSSVLWKPPGATRFCSRQAWGRRVAYSSQFMTSTDRAWLGKVKIKSRLIADLNPDEWDLPPKPKRMRWRTYQRYVEKYDGYEELLDRGSAMAAARLTGLKFPA